MPKLYTLLVEEINKTLYACFVFWSILVVTINAAQAQVNLISAGKPPCVIVRQVGATAAERRAADELATTLGEITGATVPIRDALQPGGVVAIIVGPGDVASRCFPEIDLAKFHGEEIVERTKGHRLLLAGGRPRGTLYAVYHFLEDQCGVRYWAQNATQISHKPTLIIPALNVRDEPAFEYRNPYWFSTFDRQWAAHNFDNGMDDLNAEQGGKVSYPDKYFVHTFNVLVPPATYFGTHPEWYSLINGKRTAQNAQLCLTNPGLRDFVVEQVRTVLRKSPETNIVSVSQNDCPGACQCPICKAIDDAEGSPSATMIDFVNYVADKIKPEFPNVAIDTLAYQYTRKPPKTIRPRPNVIVRLCSIECNFAEPLDAPANKNFADDMTGWSKLCNRIYVWDYSTNFAHYVKPHPNWFALGPDIRFFQRSHVKGLFSEGAYQSNGSEMAELRSYVLARLMWNPALDDKALIDEFLNGYYGNAAAPYIRRYLDLMRTAAEGVNLTCYSSPSAPFLTLKTLSAAEALWRQAESAAAPIPENLRRVRLSHLPVRYVWLARWTPLRAEAARSSTPWPMGESRKKVAAEWLATASGVGSVGWKPMTHLNESGQTPQSFIAAFDHDPIPPGSGPARHPNASPPADIPDAGTGIEIPNSVASLIEEGTWAEARADDKASDGVAVWMPATHQEWAFQIPVPQFPPQARAGRYKLYVVARIQAKSAGAPGAGFAFSAGLWDTAGGGVARAGIQAPMPPIPNGEYHSYLIGTVDLKPEQYLYVAPSANASIDSIWIDRIWLVPVR